MDVLFIVDNSGSMSEEQASLTAAIPTMVERLTTGDLDGDGIEEHAPVDSPPLGVVTTDTMRMVQVGRDLEARGAGVTIGSICQESFAPVIREIIARLAE